MILSTINVVSDGYLPGSNLGLVSSGYLYIADLLWKPVLPDPPEKERKVGGGSFTYEELEEVFQASKITVEDIMVDEIDVPDFDIPDIDNDLNDLDFDI